MKIGGTSESFRLFGTSFYSIEEMIMLVKVGKYVTMTSFKILTGHCTKNEVFHGIFDFFVVGISTPLEAFFLLWIKISCLISLEGTK